MNKCQFSELKNITSEMLISNPESFCWTDCLSYRLVTDAVMDAVWDKGYVSLGRVSQLRLTDAGWDKYYPLIVEALIKQAKENWNNEYYLNHNGYDVSVRLAKDIADAKVFKINDISQLSTEWIIANKNKIPKNQISFITANGCSKRNNEDRITLSKVFGTKLYLWNNK